MGSDARVLCFGGIGCDQHFFTNRPREGEMTFGEAIRSGFDHYVKFDGRAARPAFWWWVLFVLLVDIAANLIDLAIGVPIFSAIAGLGLLLPNLSVCNPQASRHEPVRLVDPDRPDPVDRVDRAAGLLPAAGRCRGEPFRASTGNGDRAGNDRLTRGAFDRDLSQLSATGGGTDTVKRKVKVVGRIGNWPQP